MEAALPGLERSLTTGLGAPVQLALAGLNETTSEGLCARTPPPLAVLRFSVDGAPGWIVWDNPAAIAGMERLLGSRGGEPVARRLSGVEAKLLGEILGSVARELAAPLGLEVLSPRFAQSIEAMGTWRDGGPGADAHRLEIELAIDAGSTTSTLAAYFPVPTSGEPPETGEPEEGVPAHLEEVDVELGVRLEGCVMALSELFALEEGDVVPIRARVGDPTTVVVEGHPVARARLGKHRGHLAIRIERNDGQPREPR